VVIVIFCADGRKCAGHACEKDFDKRGTVILRASDYDPSLGRVYPWCVFPRPQVEPHQPMIPKLELWKLRKSKMAGA
jgi:hypothetical protein